MNSNYTSGFAGFANKFRAGFNNTFRPGTATRMYSNAYYRQIFNNMQNVLRNIGQTIKIGVARFFTAVVRNVQAVVNKLKATYNKVATFTAGVWRGVKGFFTQLISKAKYEYGRYKLAKHGLPYKNQSSASNEDSSSTNRENYRNRAKSKVGKAFINAYDKYRDFTWNTAGKIMDKQDEFMRHSKVYQSYKKMQRSAKSKAKQADYAYKRFKKQHQIETGIRATNVLAAYGITRGVATAIMYGNSKEDDE